MFSEDTKPDFNTNLVYSIERHHHQKRILAFLQNSLPGFARQLIEAADFTLSNMREDDISREIVNLLNDRIRESSGYLFRFEAKCGPDILIYALPYTPFSTELLIAEAKRLPPRVHEIMYTQVLEGSKERNMGKTMRLLRFWAMSKIKILHIGI